MATPLHFARALGTYLARRNLHHLIVHVTGACNFRCEHCFIDFSTAKKNLKVDEMKRLAAQAGQLFWLDIAGGEPFLRKDLAEVVGAFDARVVQIPTNGSLPDLTVEVLRDMKRRTDAEIAISLSLDGMPETHARIRRQQDNWDQVWDTAERIRSVGGISIKVNTVVTNGNVDELIPLMREVRRRDVDFHSVILVRGEPAEPTVHLPALARLREMAPEIFEILGTYDYGQNPVSARILRNYHRLLWKTSLSTIEEQRQVVPCQAGKLHLVVQADGQVGSCEMLPPVGNLREQTLDEVRRSAAFKQQVRSIERGDCHCTHNCAMFGSIMFNPKTLVQLAHQRV